MTQPYSSNWRAMFDTKRQEGPPGSGAGTRPMPPQSPPTGYDDGYDPARHGTAPLSPQEVTDEAAMALATDQQEYRPWILQRGRTRPVMMLRLRKFDPRAGFWLGWQISYANLVAVEFAGDAMLSLDFGTRQFVLEGRGLSELADHLQSGTVMCVQEYSAAYWPGPPSGPMIAAIRNITIKASNVTVRLLPRCSVLEAYGELRFIDESVEEFAPGLGCETSISEHVSQLFDAVIG